MKYKQNDLIELTIEQKKMLQEGLDLGKTDNEFGDLYIAKICTNCMLDNGGMMLRKLLKKATIMKNTYAS